MSLHTTSELQYLVEPTDGAVSAVGGKWRDSNSWTVAAAAAEAVRSEAAMHSKLVSL